MLCTRLLHRVGVGYRSCSTFSSILKISEKGQVDDSKQKSAQLSNDDKAVHRLQRNDLTEEVQFAGVDPAGGTDNFDVRKSPANFKSEKWTGRPDWKRQSWNDSNSTSKYQQPKSWKHKSRRDGPGQDSDQDGTSSGRWNRSDDAWDSDESQWNRLSKPSRSKSSAPNRSGGNHHKSQSPWEAWDQDQSSPQQKRSQSKPWSKPAFSQNTHDKPHDNHDKHRGKRFRKKEKLGFIEHEPAPSSPSDEQLLYGLHPVSLALSAGLRSVLKVYHRADISTGGNGGGRLSRLVAECASRGVAMVPLPAAQLDRLAGGTGVHQGVCARVTPLLARSVDELLVQAGCPPLSDGSLQREGPSKSNVNAKLAEAAETAPAVDFWSVEAEVMGSGDQNASPSPDDRNSDRQSPTLAESESGKSPATQSGKSQVTEPPQLMTPGPEDRLSGSTRPKTTIHRLSGGSPENTALDERPARRRRVWLMLDRVQDPMNFGSIIRSSYFLGVDAVIIPDKNSCPLSPTVSKASAGTLELFPVYSVPADSCRELLQLLANRDWQLLAAETATDGAREAAGAGIAPDVDTLLVVGNEGRGVDPSLARLCRPCTVPPQRHLADGVESLNVGVATGILLSQLILAR